ncbi:helix-turn-helix domain-containing protein, partial [Escherichia coli]|uniref:helix-turn-helix domain-containing protein n=1 Tax=Escherichia coli TaxID=562 RepID=UPI001F4852DE
IICSPMTSLKTSIKTITYLSDIGCLEIQGASLQRLLIYSNHTVGKVAGICGYDNASYFVSVFRRYFGVPPHQYLSRFS